MDEKAIYSEAIQLFGEKNQTIVAIEELSELQKELCKRLRGSKTNVEHIAEEIADVYIMLAQLVQMLDIRNEVESQRFFNLLRLERRMEVIKAEVKKSGHLPQKNQNA